MLCLGSDPNHSLTRMADGAKVAFMNNFWQSWGLYAVIVVAALLAVGI